MLRAFLLTLLLVLAIALGALFSRSGFVWPGNRSEAGFANLTLGAARLRIPTPYLRADAAIDGTRIDIILLWPDLQPAPPMLDADQQARRLFVSLQSQDGEIAPEDRPSGLYARFFEPDTWSNPGGLILRRFRPGSPYQDEELYFTPPDGKVFAARCPRQGSPVDIGEHTCLYTFRLHGLDVQTRLPQALLPEWPRLTERLRALVGQWLKAA